MAKEILCTLGPASLNDRVIQRLEELGASLFRINLSHIDLEKLSDIISFVRDRTNVPICLDTEGAQVRTGKLLSGSIQINDNEYIRIVQNPVLGDDRTLNLYPNEIVEKLNIGDLVSIDFNAVLAQVVDVELDNVLLRILNGGTFGSNKAVTVDRPIEMPPLTKKDHAALSIGVAHGIDRVALSFANRGSDVDFIRSLSSPKAHQTMFSYYVEFRSYESRD